MSGKLKAADLFAAVLFAGLAVFILIQPFLGRAPRLSPGDPGPWLLPVVYGLGLAALSVALFLQAFRKARMSQETRHAVETYRDVTEPAVEEQNDTSPLIALSGMAGVTLFYVVSFERLGFYLSTGVFLFLAMVVLGPRRGRSVLIAAGIAVVTTLIVGLTLTQFLEVSLPRGLLS
ncbi:tripartite tricarboxylate transporter TctB family protein [Pseudooceanicola sp. C21-150M6]|uniref:tripartite tricarboxylate transporter TctB family protein n=1 Tax=Pseudooceanicola sp. C21-150M6 TaxID=3434355 RepID=UPI003D7FBFA1